VPSTPERTAATDRGSVLNRLASAHGHLGAVRTMASDGRPCPQVIYQLRAVRSALAQVEQILVRQHLHHCIATTAIAHDSDLLDEIVELWDYSPTRTEVGPRSSEVRAAAAGRRAHERTGS
jgi:CsoR family transcriptional regulator, copper-sensing transcriptional repressor